MLKSYDELLEIDVSNACDERDGIKYLNWAKCIRLLHENGAKKVYFEPLVNEKTGSTLFCSDIVFDNGKEGDKKKVNRCYEVRVKIVIDDLEFIHNYPLMNGTNPVCDNSMSQLRLANAQKRAFVKGVAIMTGLGFNLWVKEEEEMQKMKDNEPLSPLLLLQLKEQFGEEWTHIISKHKGESADALAQKIGLADNEEMRAWYSMFTKLYNLFVAMQDL